MSRIQKLNEINAYFGPGISGLREHMSYCKNVLRDYYRNNDIDNTEKEQIYIKLLKDYKESKEIFYIELKKQIKVNPDLIDSEYLFSRDDRLIKARDEYDRLNEEGCLDAEIIPDVESPYYSIEEPETFQFVQSDNSNYYEYQNKEIWRRTFISKKK